MIFGGTKFKNCGFIFSLVFRIHFSKVFHLTHIGKKRQYEGKQLSV